MKMGEEIKNITAPNGRKIEDTIARGWGSMAQISIDGNTGDVKDIKRLTTREDEAFKQMYLSFLEKQFQEEDASKAEGEEEAKTPQELEASIKKLDEVERK